MGRTPCCEKNGLKKGPWTPEEDQKLIDYIQRHGHGNWRALPKRAELLRCGKSCRLRWTNYLRPDIKRGNFSLEEDHMIIQLHALLGNKWSAIAASLPGRTDNEIKNYWNTHLRKRLLQMGIDPVTHRPRTDILGFSDMQAPFASSGLSCHMVQLESARLEESLKLVADHEMANMASSENGNFFMMSLRHQLGDSMNKSIINSLADPAWAPQVAISNLDYNGFIPQSFGQVMQPKKIDAESLANQINVNRSLIMQGDQRSVGCFIDNMCSLGLGKSSSDSLHIDHGHHAISPIDGIQLKMENEIMAQCHERTPNAKPCERSMRVSHENIIMVGGDSDMLPANLPLEVPIQQAGNSYERAIPPEVMFKFAENSSVQQKAVTIGLGNSTSAGAGTPLSSDLNSQEGKDYWRIMLKSVATRPSELSSVSSAIS